MKQCAQIVILVTVFFVAAFATGGVRPGGWSNSNENDEGLLIATKAAVKNISESSNSLYHTKLVRVINAKQQVVSGMRYNLTLEVSHTTCKKNEVSHDSVDNCPATGTPQICSVIVWSQPWLGPPKVQSTSCSASSGQISLEDHLFHNFLETYKKKYISEEEKAKRFQIFKNNLKRIYLLNIHEEGSAKYGVTKFADLTEKEFESHYLGFRPDLQVDEARNKAKINVRNLPDSFDWRDKNVITEVKDQGQCGSCWAFSTTGNIEGMWAIKKKQLVSLSEQELVDCDKVDEGCNGGLPSNAYKEIMKMGGLESETDYPYEGVDQKCSFNKTEVRVYINDSLEISQNETEMANWLVQNGPISIGINANAMQFYFGGVSHPPKFLCSPKNLDHGVLIVGFGVHTYPIFKTTLPFWIVKNSWGKSWGEQGYYRVYRGDGTCGLNQMATSAVVL